MQIPVMLWWMVLRHDAESAHRAVQGEPSRGMFNSMQTAEKDLKLRTKKLVNALSPMWAAYDSNDEDPGDSGEPEAAVRDAAPGHEVASIPADGEVEQAAAPPLSLAPPLPAEEPPPLLSDSTATGGSMLKERQQPAVPKRPGPGRDRSPVPRQSVHASRRRSRSDSVRRGGSTRRGSRSRSLSRSPPRRAGRSPAGHRGRTRTRSRSLSPNHPRRHRGRSPSRTQRRVSVTLPSSARRRAEVATDRSGSSRRRDRHSGSNDRRGRSHSGRTATETLHLTTSVSRRLEHVRPGQPAQSPVPHMAPLKTDSGATAAVPTSPVSPAADAIPAQPSVLCQGDDVSPAEQSEPATSDKPGSRVAILAQQQEPETGASRAPEVSGVPATKSEPTETALAVLQATANPAVIVDFPFNPKRGV